MKPKKKEEKPMRKMVSTTLRVDLWQGLQVEAIKRGVNANDILEELIDVYLKKAERKGGER
jgi:hypothetical protein